MLREKQKIVQEKYNQVIQLFNYIPTSINTIYLNSYFFLQDSINNENLKKKHLELENIIKAYHNVINSCNPNANILDVDILTREVQNDHNSFSEFN